VPIRRKQERLAVKSRSKRKKRNNDPTLSRRDEVTLYLTNDIVSEGAGKCMGGRSGFESECKGGEKDPLLPFSDEKRICFATTETVFC